jgi:hypothetical protein
MARAVMYEMKQDHFCQPAFPFAPSILFSCTCVGSSAIVQTCLQKGTQSYRTSEYVIVANGINAKGALSTVLE